MNPSNIQNALGEIEPTALMGLEALLHLVQASNPSHPVPGPVPHLALTGPNPDRNNHAVHIAATALSQLSQQATPGMPPPSGPMAEILHQVNYD